MTIVHVKSENPSVDQDVDLTWVEHRDLNTKEVSREAQAKIKLNDDLLVLHFFKGGRRGPDKSTPRLFDAILYHPGGELENVTSAIVVS